MDTCIQKLRNKDVLRQASDVPEDYEFYFNEDKVGDEQTPQQLGRVNKDTIDMQTQQHGVRATTCSPETAAAAEATAAAEGEESAGGR